jgi:hypothetical protein
LPEIALAPDHAPDAEQEPAFVEDHVSVEDPPLATDVGFAESDTVGTGGGVDPPEAAGADPVSAPPQAERAKESSGTRSNVLVCGTGHSIPE